MTEVLPTNEARAKLNQIAARFDHDGPDAATVVFGSHRRAQGVIVSYVEVSDYTVQFNLLDRTFALDNGLLRMTVMGRCGRGCSGTLGVVTNKNYTPPTPGTLYTYTPSWHGKYILVSDKGAGYQCANSVLTYKRGTTTYTFSHTNVCQGALP